MNQAFNKYLFRKKIDITSFCSPDAHFVELREPTVAEFKTLTKMVKLVEKEDAEQQMEAASLFCSQLSTLIVDHDFFDETKKTDKLPSKEVADFISSKTDMTVYVLSEYMSSLPLVKGTARK